MKKLVEIFKPKSVADAYPATIQHIRNTAASVRNELSFLDNPDGSLMFNSCVLHMTEVEGHEPKVAGRICGRLGQQHLEAGMSLRNARAESVEVLRQKLFNALRDDPRFQDPLEKTPKDAPSNFWIQRLGGGDTIQNAVVSWNQTTYTASFTTSPDGSVSLLAEKPVCEIPTPE